MTASLPVDSAGRESLTLDQPPGAGGINWVLHWRHLSKDGRTILIRRGVGVRPFNPAGAREFLAAWEAETGHSLSLRDIMAKLPPDPRRGQPDTEEVAALSQTTLHQDPTIAELGRAYWARLHQQAEEFRQAVKATGTGCGCGDTAVAAAQAMHDAVSAHLGKKVQHPEVLASMARFYQDATAKMEQAKVDGFRIETSGGVSSGQAVLSNTFVEFLLNALAQGIGATVGAAVAAKGLGIGGTVVTSPEAGFRIVGDRPEEEEAKKAKAFRVVDDKPTATVGVYSPSVVEGDQATVDVGTLLEEIDVMLKDPSLLGLVDPKTQRVLKEAA